MSEVKTRKVHTPEFKAKVGLEALRGVKTINEIGQEHGVHPVQVGQWKKAIQEQAKTLFEGKRGPKPVAAHREPELLYSEIGKLKVELDWLKKKSGISLSVMRRAWIEPGEAWPWCSNASWPGCRVPRSMLSKSLRCSTKASCYTVA
jgi:transposase